MWLTVCVFHESLSVFVCPSFHFGFERDVGFDCTNS